LIARLCAILCGVALTWMCASFGLSLLHDYRSTCHGPCKQHTARRGVANIEQAILLFAIDENRCPSGNDELIRGHYVAVAGLVDPWGTAIAYSCVNGEPKARSAGPDRRFGTPDDVTSD
jgi:hypothetical protein